MKDNNNTMKSFFQSFRTFLRILWRIIRIIWYWVERFILVILLVGIAVGMAWWTSQKASLNRDWDSVDAVLPAISWVEPDLVNIKNIRNHQWSSDTEFTPGYYEDTFDLNMLTEVYYVITPFSGSDGPAHTMLTFSFADGRHLAISGEIRKERGESFDAVGGILNQYELIYVIATEEDIIKLRTNYRNNKVYMYPINTPKEKIQALFRSMLIRADKLTKEPEFYNTLWNNCTTSLLTHANALRQDKIKGGTYTILPSHSDTLLYDAGLISTKLSLYEAREYYKIDETARTLPENANFSQSIRKEIK